MTTSAAATAANKRPGIYETQAAGQPLRFLLLLMEVLYVPGGFVWPYVGAVQSGYKRFARKQKNGVPSGRRGFFTDPAVFPDFVPKNGKWEILLAKESKLVIIYG